MVKNRKSLIIFVLLFIGVIYFTNGQSIDFIKNSGQYIYGSGTDITPQKADASALHDLVSRISTTVNTKFEYSFKNSQTGTSENVNAIVNTYSHLTLNFAGKIEQETDNGFMVFRYIKKEDIDKLFEARAKKIESYTLLASEAEEEYRIGDALRYYFWAYILLKSHPESNKLSFNKQGSQSIVYEAFLPDRINRIFSLLTVETGVAEKRQNNIAIPATFSFKNTPVRNLDYSFWTGNVWTKQTGVTDGKGIFDFFGEQPISSDKIRVRFEYTYSTKIALDKDLACVMEGIAPPKFANSEIEISIGEKNTSLLASANSITVEKKTSVENTGSSDEFSKPEEITLAIAELIKTKDYDKAYQYFSDDGKDIFNRLIKYGKATVVPGDINLLSSPSASGTVIRPVPVKFDFPNNNRNFIENLSFTFNKENKIIDINFAVDKVTAEGILKQTRWPENVKWELIRFLEVYKTAYALERIDFIEDVFADNALIIVGRKVEKAEPLDKMYQSLGNDKYEFVRKSKAEYIESLRHVFLNNEFVNINFSESSIKKRDPESQVYGIQLEQDYYSNNYGDHGFLFLMVDMKDTLKPKIYVRSWQPEKNEDGSVIGLNDFKF